METSRKPILKYLIKNNKNHSGFRQFKKQAVVDRIAHMLIRAQTVISRAYRRWYLRRSKANNIFEADIHIGELLHYNKQIYLLGDFTDNPWMDKLKMNYSYLHRSYFVRAQIMEGSKFKFQVNGTYKLSKGYEVKTEISGEKLNTFSLNRNQSNKILYQIKRPKTHTLTGGNCPKFYHLVKKSANQIKTFNQSQPNTKFTSLSKILTTIPGTRMVLKTIYSKKHPDSKIYCNKTPKIYNTYQIKPK
jgi:hypothetical protein